MKTNAFILDWTMNDYESFQEELTGEGFYFEKDNEEKNHIKVGVPYEKLDEFARLCQKHLNKKVNYVDVQFPDKKETVVIFQENIHRITSKEQNEEVRSWAIENGLPVEQADWGTSY